MINKVAYLGDGLYAKFDGWQICLYAHDGVRATNEVFLEPSVLVSFENYLKDLKDFVKNDIIKAEQKEG